jgi:branched-chain amino acid transport system ATP-binding protein
MRFMRKIALSIKGLQVKYGAIEAVKGINLDVYEGDVVAILGANGAGKTSTLRTISGLVEDAEGSILYNGEEILGMEP